MDRATDGNRPSRGGDGRPRRTADEIRRGKRRNGVVVVLLLAILVGAAVATVASWEVRIHMNETGDVR